MKQICLWKRLFLAVFAVWGSLAHAGKTFTLSPACQDKSLEYDKKCKSVVPTDAHFQGCMDMVKEVGTACSIPNQPSNAARLLTPECKQVTQKYCNAYRKNPNEQTFNECFKDHQKEMAICKKSK